MPPNVFEGKIEELENVLVDNFLHSETHTCFFLSHCHTDHMTGIEKLLEGLNRSDCHIYCSPISRLILLNKYNFTCKNFIEELTSTRVIVVPGTDDVPSYQMTVTTIPAGHCPGSVMFLFETVNHTVLYTGDFRISKGDISKFKPLHSKNQIKLINKIYFDSTFLNENYWEFPSRSKAVSELITLIETWLRKGLSNEILLITSALIGYEFVFIEVAKKLNWKIHVKDLLYDFYVNVPDVGYYLTKDCISTKIHACSTFDKKCIRLDDARVLKVKLSAQWYNSTKDLSQQPLWKKVSDESILLCYSTHCSCSELIDFLKYLKPKDIQPCTAAVGSTSKDTEEFSERLVSSWRILECLEDEPETKKARLRLERNYSFELKLSY